MFRIEYNGNKHANYATLDAARQVANEIAETTGVIVGITDTDTARKYPDGTVQECVICALPMRTNESYFYGAHGNCARVAVKRASR